MSEATPNNALTNIEENNVIVSSRPSYIPSTIQYSDSQKEMLRYTKPPRFKIIQVLAGEKFKPRFQDGDGIIVPQMAKICSFNPPSLATFVITNFYTFYGAKNPAQTTGQLMFLREQSFDPKSDIARKAMKFVDEPCPESPGNFIKYRQFLNYMVCFPDIEEIRDIPIMMSFNGGLFKDGEQLNSLWQSRRAPWEYCRFRVGTSWHKGKGTNKQLGADFYNDPREWCTEEEAAKYKSISDMLEPIIQSRSLDVDYDDTDLEAANSANAAAETKY